MRPTGLISLVQTWRRVCWDWWAGPIPGGRITRGENRVAATTRGFAWTVLPFLLPPGTLSGGREVPLCNLDPKIEEIARSPISPVLFTPREPSDRHWQGPRIAEKFSQVLISAKRGSWQVRARERCLVDTAAGGEVARTGKRTCPLGTAARVSRS